MSIINLVSIKNNADTMHPRSFSRNITDSYTMWQFPATVKMMKWNDGANVYTFETPNLYGKWNNDDNDFIFD